MLSNPAARVALMLTCLGLMADIAYFATEAAVRFLFIHQWALACTYGVLSLAAYMWIATVGWSRVKAAIGVDDRG